MNDDPVIYADSEPDIEWLSDQYHSAILNLDEYFDVCRKSYDDRRNIWPGKSEDLRKNGPNAFPWQGASDQETNVVGERLDTYVALFDQALQRSHIRAFPTSVATLGRASVVSAFLKWMRSTYIKDFKGQMELSGNRLLEKGIAVTYVGWCREKRSFLQRMSIDEIASTVPEIADIIMAGDEDDALAGMLVDGFGTTEKRAMKALRDLRATGEAELPVPRVSVDRPVVHSCATDGDVFFPEWVTDIQRSPWVIWRSFLTPQELEKKAENEGWDEDWVAAAIEKLVGNDSDKLDGEKQHSMRLQTSTDSNGLVMVLHAYQRLIDKEDGSEGIYRTVFHPDAEGYALHELVNGYDEYPFVATKISSDQARLYESAPMSSALRGPQFQIKVERDSRIDRASLATLPPMMHPAGRPPVGWQPGGKVPYRRLGEIAFGPTPPLDAGSIEVENAMRQQADRAVGLDPENPYSGARQSFYIGKFLDHVRDVLALAWKLYQRMGPDEVFFQVSGIADPQTMTKGSPDEEFSIVVAFDSQMTDPETADTQVRNMVSMLQFDRNGRIDVDKLLEIAANGVSPVLADYVLQPQEAAADKMQREVTDDLAKIFAGIEVPARPNGAQYALQMVQAYAQQPDVAQRLQQDEAFAERLNKYAEQYSFALQQAQNAQIGRIGTEPAQMGGVQTQQMQ